MSTLAVDKIFADRDFEDMMYPVMEHDKMTNIMGVFPDLQKLPSWRAFNDPTLPKNIVYRYIVLCYDRQSPIFKKFLEDEGKRKSTAALYAGWVANSEGFFDENIEEVFRCKVQMINYMIIDYVRQYNDPEYALLVTGYEAYFKKLEQLMNAEIEGGNARS